MYPIKRADHSQVTDVSFRPKSKMDLYRLTIEGVHTDFLHFGVDPGTAHFGLAAITSMGVEAWELDFSKCLPDGVVDRLHLIYQVFGQIAELSIAGRNRIFVQGMRAVVEGASYGDVNGQVDLAHSRAAMILALSARFQQIETTIVAPGTIRKAVLGHGHAKPQDVWADVLPSNAANALACALYSYEQENN